MGVFHSESFDRHEAVHFFCEPDAGLRAIIALHSTHLGPALGGCRVWSYDNEADALKDALRLSRGMSYKNALAGLPFGGGKAVVWRDPEGVVTPSLMEAFGRAVDRLGGQYVTAEDVGVSVEHMRSVARYTAHVCGLPAEGSSRPGGDPSPWTALGVFEGIREAVRYGVGRRDLEGVRVAVQGLGHVGLSLCESLHEAGARLVVADLDHRHVEQAQDRFSALAMPAGEILFADVEVLSPCALGATLNAASIPKLRCHIVAGAANNQLACDADGERLRERGILYAPDYVINAGGVINVAAEYRGACSRADVRKKVCNIAETLRDIFDRSEASALATNCVADDIARRRIRESGKGGACGSWARTCHG